MESPKLWPENTEYPSGYAKKNARPVTSSRYSRETTVVMDQAPPTSFATSNILNRSVERQMLSDYTTMEKDRTYLSLPMTAQQQFHANWDDRLQRDATKTLKVTMNRETPAYEAHTLSDPTDVMRYSGTTAMIVNSQSSEEVKFRARMERSKSTIPYDLRWKKLIVLFRAIKQRLKRDITMEELIFEIASRIRADSTRLGAATIVNRSNFVNILASVPALEGFDTTLFSAIYGVFDPLKKNSIRYVEVIKSLALLDNFEYSTEEKLAVLWDINMTYGQDMSPFDMALTILTTVCGCDADSAVINKLFTTLFKPACYRTSIANEKIPGMASSDADDLEKGMEGDASSTASPIVKQDQVMSALPAYNIINDFLNQRTFVTVVKSCPPLFKKFEECLDARLQACYGKETVRPKAGEEEGASSAGSDFTWILKKKKKIGSKAPTIARRPTIKKDDVASMLQD